MRRLWISAVATVFAAWEASAGSTSIVVQPPLGTFKMREELRGRHPRLYFTKEDIPDIRRRARGPNRWFLDRAKANFRRVRGDPKTNPAGWELYLYGFWGLVAADMIFMIEGDTAWRDGARKLALWLARDHWWVKDDLAPMDALSGLAITYDILYDEFTEEERGRIRQAMVKGMDFVHERFFVGQYWTHDYQNNHMHNRIHGLANAAFAILGDDPALDVRKHADLAYSQFLKVIEWLPEDGSQHEGPGYWSYGHHWVVRLVHLMEHVTGEDFCSRNPHFANSHHFRIYMTAPGWKHTLNIGDGGAGTPGNLTTLCRPVAEAKDPHGAAFIREMMDVNPGEFYQHPAWGLLWYDASIEPRPLEELPLWRFWPDLEMFSIRSSWRPDAAAFVFKCGPPGGHRLQKLRKGWANVAHDHPDQNHFLLFAHGRMLAEDDGYPKEKKLTRSHNTITVDGKGQPREGTGWYQPFAYDKTGFLRDVFLTGATAYAAGDAGRCYEGADRFLRHVAFVEGEYLVVLDDLVGSGNQEHAFEWRLHKAGDWKEVEPGHFSVADGDAALDIRFLAPPADVLESEFLPAELTAKPCLAVRHRARRTRFLAVLVPRKAGAPGISCEALPGRNCTAVRTRGPGFEDTFAVAERPGAFAFGKVRASGAAALVRMGRGGEAESAFVARGTSLAVGGGAILAASRPSNLAWRKAAGGVHLEAEAAYKADGGKTVVGAGGFRAGGGCAVSVDGQRARSIRADGRGVVKVELDLSARRAVRIRGGAFVPRRAPAPTGAEPDGRTRPAGPTAQEIAAAKDAEEKLRRAIIEGARRGGQETVTIDVAGSAMRGTLVAADEDGITVRVRGMEMEVPWSSLSPRRLYGIAKRYSDDHDASGGD